MHRKTERKKDRYSSSWGNPTSELRDVTCHMGSHNVTCHPTQVNAPRLTPAMQGVLDLPTPEILKSELT